MCVCGDNSHFISEKDDKNKLQKLTHHRVVLRIIYPFHPLQLAQHFVRGSM